MTSNEILLYLVWVLFSYIWQSVTSATHTSGIYDTLTVRERILAYM